MLDEAAPPAAAKAAAFPLVTLAEAAAALGRPKEALRAMVRRGKLRAVRGNGGQFLVELSTELREMRGRPRRGRAAELEGAATDGAAKPPEAATGRAAELVDVVEEWRLAAEEARLEAAVAAARLEATERAHAAEVAVLRQQIETEVAARNAVIEELRAELARLRLPFWRRWLGP